MTQNKIVDFLAFCLKSNIQKSSTSAGVGRSVVQISATLVNQIRSSLVKHEPAWLSPWRAQIWTNKVCLLQKTLTEPAYIYGDICTFQAHLRPQYGFPFKEEKAEDLPEILQNVFAVEHGDEWCGSCRDDDNGSSGTCGHVTSCEWVQWACSREAIKENNFALHTAYCLQQLGNNETENHSWSQDNLTPGCMTQIKPWQQNPGWPFWWD